MAELFYFTATIIGFLVIVIKKNKSLFLLYIFVFSLPFFGLMYDIGIQINLDRIWALFMFLFMLHKLKIQKKLYLFLIFMIFAFYSTFIMSQFLPATTKIFPPFRGKYRYLTQIIMWLLLVIPVMYIPKFIKEESQLKTIYNLLVISCIFLSVLGIIQFFSIYFFNYDPFPIGFFEEEAKRYAIFEYKGITINRISSLGGEPKHFAYSIAHILPLFIVGISLNLIKFRFKFLIIALFLINLFLTFSTQGYFLFIINLVISLFLMLFFRRSNKTIIMTILFFLFLFFVILTPTFYNIIMFRTVDRIMETGLLEDWNIAVLDFLFDNPRYILTGVGLGNVHFYAKDYIPVFASHYMYDNVFVAKSGFLRIISELGIVGFVLFLLSYLKPLIRLFKKARYDNMALLTLIFGLYTLISFALSWDGPNYIFSALGILYWYEVRTNGGNKNEN